MRNILQVLFCLLIGMAVNARPLQKFVITDFGAIADGKTVNTVAIQKAVDAAVKAGGGVVVISKGNFLTGTIRLYSHIEIHFDDSAVLSGSTDWSDYQKNRWYAILLAQKADHISLTGNGTIDGQGVALAEDVVNRIKKGEIIDTGSFRTHNRPDEKYRPMLLEFRNCNNVEVKDITLKNSSGWVQTYAECVGLTISGIKVESNAYWNNDGIDVVDCKNVSITDCDVNADDDGICLKSGNENSSCENITIKHCRIRSSASGMKFGTPSHGGFKHIRISDLYIYNTFRTAIALELVDGGQLEDIEVSNITAVNTGGAIFLRLGQRVETAANGSFKDVYIHDMKVQIPAGKPDKGYTMAGPEKYVHNPFPSEIVGLPLHPVSNVRIENIQIKYEGVGDSTIAYTGIANISKIPENPKNYPEFNMFGELPCWGLFVRHAANISLKNISFEMTGKDFRPTMIFDDVDGLHLESVTTNHQHSPSVVFRNVKKTELSGNKLPGEIFNQQQ